MLGKVPAPKSQDASPRLQTSLTLRGVKLHLSQTPSEGSKRLCISLIESTGVRKIGLQAVDRAMKVSDLKIRKHRSPLTRIRQMEANPQWMLDT